MFRRMRAIETNRATKRLLSEQMANAGGSHYNKSSLGARGRIMPSFRDADLAAIKARYESITHSSPTTQELRTTQSLSQHSPKLKPVRPRRRARKRRSQKQFTPEVGRVSALPPRRYSR